MEEPSCGLSLHQRNIFRYFLAHKQRHKHSPCFVPRTTGSQVYSYLRAIEALEGKGLVIVDRSAQHYTGWILNYGPARNKTQQGLTGSWK